MATISSTGVGSGLDVGTIVSSLMSVEKQPLKLLQTKATVIQSKISAFGTLKGNLASLGDIASRLSTASNWNPLTVDSTDSTVASATAANTAQAGTHSLTVSQLAQAQVLSSGNFASPASAVGTGKLLIELGTTAAGVFTPASGSLPVSVTIDSGKSTLAGVRDAINASGAGVTASIVNGGTGAKLVLRGSDGAVHSMRLTATDDDGNPTDAAGLSALAYDPAATAGAGRNLTQTQPAQDATFNLDGVETTSASNNPSDVLEGVTLSFKKVSATPVNLSVNVQTMAVRKNVNDFISAYNGLNTLLKNQTAVDPGGTGSGPLQSDNTAVTMLGALHAMLRGSVTGMAAPDNLNAAGIELRADGSLALNETRFAKVLTTPGKLATLFSQPQSGADPASRGFGVRFKQWSEALTGTSGTITTRLANLKQSVDSNQKSQDSMNDRLSVTEARLRAQYQRLDSKMSTLNAQMAQMKSALGLA